jgi:hypothetical protein
MNTLTSSRSTNDASDLEALRRQARRRVARQLGFLIHLVVYLAVNGGLVALRLLRGEAPVVHGPMLGWGLGLLIHGIVTLVALRGETVMRGWVDRETERLAAQKDR